jgi:hypothetical protein
MFKYLLGGGITLSPFVYYFSKEYQKNLKLK